MEIKIDIDMNKIDYDAINEEILKKVKEMDISENYRIDDTIRQRVVEVVNTDARDYIERTWGYNTGIADGNKLSNRARDNITELAKNEIKERIAIVINDLFDKIPKEELDKMIAGLIPQIIVSMIVDNLKDLISNYYYGAMANMNQIAEKKLREILSDRCY